MFDRHVSECLALVVNPDHQRYGQMGQIEWHDWKEYGTIRVKFPDGTSDEFFDGLCEGDRLAETVIYDKKHIDKVIEILEQMSELKPFIVKIRSVVDDRDFSTAVREKAREQFRDIFFTGIPPESEPSLPEQKNLFV